MGKDLDYSDLGAYLVSISRRIASLEVDIERIDEEIGEQGDRIQAAGESVKNEMQRLSKQIREMNLQISALSRTVTNVIHDFKTIARQESMERLQRKVDDWNPEGMATIRDLHRALKTKKQQLSETL